MNTRERSADARGLDVAAAARAGAQAQGRWPIAGMQRLAAELAGLPDTAVEWSAQASLFAVAGSEAQTWLRLEAHAQVPLQCQRCLQPLLQPIDIDRRFRFVRTEAEAELLDEEIEDDVLVLQPRLDLHELLEDELILALPLVPRHEACPEPLSVPASAADVEDEEPALHPFAALAALRRGGGDEGGGGKS